MLDLLNSDKIIRLVSNNKIWPLLKKIVILIVILYNWHMLIQSIRTKVKSILWYIYHIAKIYCTLQNKMSKVFIMRLSTRNWDIYTSSRMGIKNKPHFISLHKHWYRHWTWFWRLWPEITWLHKSIKINIYQ